MQYFIPLFFIIIALEIVQSKRGRRTGNPEEVVIAFSFIYRTAMLFPFLIILYFACIVLSQDSFAIQFTQTIRITQPGYLWSIILFILSIAPAFMSYQTFITLHYSPAGITSVYPFLTQRTCLWENVAGLEHRRIIGVLNIIDRNGQRYSVSMELFGALDFLLYLQTHLPSKVRERDAFPLKWAVDRAQSKKSSI